MNGSDFLSDLVLHRTYAHTKEDGTKESWADVTERVFAMHKKKYRHVKDVEFWEMFDKTKALVSKKKVMPSMRSAQFAGKAVESENIRMFNCSFLVPKIPKDFADIVYLAMCGAGIGVGIPTHITLSPRKDTKEVFMVSDDKKGWADAVQATMNNPWVKIDISQVRPKGSPISSGGTASGGEVLLNGCNEISKIMRRAIRYKGIFLNPIEIADIVCFIAQMVIVGGVRRSATIGLMNELHAKQFKKGEWWKHNPQRSFMNVSAYNTEDRDTVKAMKYALENGGEPGLTNVYMEDAALWGTNPCSEIALKNYGFCNLTEINAPAVQSSFDFHNCMKAAVFLGTLQAGYTDFNYISLHWKQNAESEALLGVSITGVAQCFEPLGEWLTQLHAQEVSRIQRASAKWIGINPAKRICCIKPSGTTSAFLGTTSGVHAVPSSRFVRRVRIEKDNPTYKAIAAHSLLVPFIEDSTSSPDTAIISMPIELAGAANWTAEHQACVIRFINDNWVAKGHFSGKYRHNVSATLYVAETDNLEKIVENIGQYSFTVLKRDDTTYAQAPFTWFYGTEAEWQQQVDAFAQAVEGFDFGCINYSDYRSDFKASAACSGGQCEFGI